MNQESLEKIQDKIIEMNYLDIHSLIAKKTNQYQDICNLLQEKPEDIANIILLLKFRIFTLEKEKNKWTSYGVIVTIVALSILGAWIQ